MFVPSFACAFLLAAGVAAQEPSSSVEGFMTIQTSMPALTVSTAPASPLVPTRSSADPSMSTDLSAISTLLSITTGGPLTNPLSPTLTIPQLTFCNGVYTNTPCTSATGVMSIPQGETPLPSSAGASSAGGASPAPTSTPSGDSGEQSSSGRITPTSSVSGSVPSPSTSNVNTPGAASSLLKGDSLIWAAALSGLSAALGFAFTLL